MIIKISWPGPLELGDLVLNGTPSDSPRNTPTRIFSHTPSCSTWISRLVQSQLGCARCDPGAGLGDEEAIELNGMVWR